MFCMASLWEIRSIQNWIATVILTLIDPKCLQCKIQPPLSIPDGYYPYDHVVSYQIIFTPHICDIVCVSVSVCLSPLARPNRLEFWHEGQVEGYLGQGHRSKVKITRSKNVHWDVTLTSESIVMMDLPKKNLRNMTGVFNAYALSLFTGSVPSLVHTGLHIQNVYTHWACPRSMGSCGPNWGILVTLEWLCNKLCNWLTVH